MTFQYSKKNKLKSTKLINRLFSEGIIIVIYHGLQLKKMTFIIAKNI